MKIPWHLAELSTLVITIKGYHEYPEDKDITIITRGTRENVNSLFTDEEWLKQTFHNFSDIRGKKYDIEVINEHNFC